MIGLLGLCNSILDPINQAAATTSIKKAKSRAIVGPRKRLGKEPVPPYSPIWHYASIRGRKITSITFVDGVRLKKCPSCMEHKPADTINFNIELHNKIGLSVYCRPCWRTKQRC